MGIRVHDEEARRRISAITERLLLGMVESGGLNPDDDKALEAATAECAKVARDAYYAALEYVSG